MPFERDLSDTALVQAARGGDQGAFAMLVERHRSVAVRVCRRLYRDFGQAEDAVQEAILVAWLHLEQLRESDRFGAWLAGIALRVCRGWLRYEPRNTWSLEALLGGRLVHEPVDWSASPAESLEQAEFVARVRRGVADLPPGQQSAVALFYLRELPHAETAALLGIEVNAVKARLHKARAHLRHTLSHLWSEEHMTGPTETTAEFIDVQVEDVRAIPVADPPGERRIIVLADPSGERLLPIWVGQFEGDAIAISLVHARAPRPLTFAFAARLLAAAGGRVQEVRIDRLTDETFYAQVVLDTAVGLRTVDARPSDAIALALEIGTPVRVAVAVMNVAAISRQALVQKSGPDARSAQAQAEDIRQLVTMPRRSRASVF